LYEDQSIVLLTWNAFFAGSRVRDLITGSLVLATLVSKYYMHLLSS
jgi:hypothetical protein